MPYDIECISKHRTKENVECDQCSEGFSFNLKSIGELSSISDSVLNKILESSAWKPHAEKTSYVVRYIMHEACVNAIEHGALGLGKSEKKRLLAEMRDAYYRHIEEKWAEKKSPIAISLCINDSRVLLGVHDEGGGFDYKFDSFSPIPSDEILEPSGKGLAILNNFGLSICWNEKGNSILCSFKLPSA